VVFYNNGGLLILYLAIGLVKHEYFLFV